MTHISKQVSFTLLPTWSLLLRMTHPVKVNKVTCHMTFALAYPWIHGAFPCFSLKALCFTFSCLWICCLSCLLWFKNLVRGWEGITVENQSWVGVMNKKLKGSHKITVYLRANPNVSIWIMIISSSWWLYVPDDPEISGKGVSIKGS
jgi:hypothetical protein